jgi:DNA polymerase
VMFDCNKKWARIRLPSGRFLCYPLPQLHRGGTISYMAYRNKRWGRTKTYGGKLAENITQAVARDVLAYSLPLAEEQGLPVVLHVHDEIVAEVPDQDTDALSRLSALMTRGFPWSKGLPLAAEGFETTRYRK